MDKLQKVLMLLFLAVVSLGLSGCGAEDAFSGSGDIDTDGDGGGTTGTVAISLQLVNPGTGLSTTIVSATAPGELRATVTSDGTPLSSEVVTFSTTIGTLNPASGTALTSATGTASMGLLDGGVAGAGTATAEVTIDGVTATATVTFSVLSGGGGGGGTGPAISLILLDQATGLPSSSISSTTPGILQATLTDSGVPLASEVITFTTTLGDLSPISGTALTNASGIGSVNLLDGGAAGAGTAIVTASINGVTVQSSASFQVLAGAAATTTIDMGNGTGVAFVADVIDLGGVTTLSAGGTLTATVDIVETSNANAAYTTPANVIFTSTCTSAGQSTLDSPVATVGGRASSTYLATGCVGTDTITATANISGTTYTSQANVTVQAPTVGSIRFKSASQDVIAIQGTGGAGLSETSTVIFTVFDATGNPVPNQPVNFVLSTTVGGITLSPSSAVTNALGDVQTVVNSGTVNTTVQVTATVAATAISTQSGSLAISTGLPDQNSFSIALSTKNPSAWETNGVTVPVTIFVADHFNNPAPDGTAVAFTTEGGFIDGSCITTTGQCTVNWVSDDPRPADGRATILATTIGEEGFTDTNGNGRFDNGEPFTDLAEAWRDDDESGTRDAGEEFLDFNVSGTYDTANTLYNGTLCGAGATQCDPSGTLVHTRSSIVLVMASRFQLVSVYDTKGTASTADDVDVTFGGLTVKDDGTITQIRVDIRDARGQVPPISTTVSIEAKTTVIAEKTIKVLGTPVEATVPNTNSAGPFSVFANVVGEPGSPAAVVEITLGVPGVAETTLQVPATVADVTGPTFDTILPLFAATGVAVNDPISVTFSEAMNSASVLANISIIPALAGIWDFDINDNKAAFLPSANMANNTVYTVTVGAAATDLAGNQLNSLDGVGAASQSWSFRTTP